MLTLILALCLPAAADTLDLESATRLAAERALDANSAELSVSRQQIALTSASRAWTPSLSLRAGSQGSLGRTFSEQLGANITEPVASLSTSLTASMPLYEGGALRATRQGAEAALGASKADQAQTHLDLRWLMADGLLQIEQARDAMAVQEVALEADRALLEQVSLQVEAGSRTEADRYSQQAVVSSSEASLASARQTLTEAQLTLLTLLRLDPADGWSFEAPPALGEAGGERALIQQALEQRPDLQAAQERISASLAAERQAQSDWLPSVSLGAGASTSWLSSNPDPLGFQLEDQSSTWVSVDLSLPLLDAGVRRASVDTAAVAVRESELAQQRLTDQVALEVRLLLAEEQAARASVEASTSTVESARQAADVLSLRYQAGSEPLVSLTSARADLVDAQLASAHARSALQRVRYQLAWVTGEL